VSNSGKGAPPQTATFDRLPDARDWACKTEGAIIEGKHFTARAAKRHTVGEMLEQYIRDILPQKRASTIPDQLRQLRWWNAQIGASLLADVTASVIADQRDRLARGEGNMRSPATVNRYLGYRSKAGHFAVDPVL
jgi:hypothetical protein